MREKPLTRRALRPQKPLAGARRWLSCALLPFAESYILYLLPQPINGFIISYGHHFGATSSATTFFFFSWYIRRSLPLQTIDDFFFFYSLSSCCLQTREATNNLELFYNPRSNDVAQDLPESSLAGTTVRVMYSLGLVLTSPLQLFPAVKVSPTASKSGKRARAFCLAFLEFVFHGCFCVAGTATQWYIPGTLLVVVDTKVVLRGARGR